ncbi:MAG TPA: alpha/beta hydrolase [Pyrinomonadaceae bacterium]|nr:alpha/beta hydrolase [Pyrinomonadaceae bacterium]
MPERLPTVRRYGFSGSRRIVFLRSPTKVIVDRPVAHSDVPALFISGTLDARTPISNAEEYRKGFPNSTHIVIENAVHSDP